MLQHVLRHPGAGQGSPYMQARIQGRAGSELIVRVRHCHCQGGGLPPEDRRRPNGTRTGQARGSVPQASRWCLRGCCEGARVLCELPTPPCWRLCHEDWRVPPRAARARPIGEVEPPGPVPQICVQPHASKAVPVRSKCSSGLTVGTKIEMSVQSCCTSWDTKIASVRGLGTSRRTEVRASAQNFRASWVTKIAVGVRSLYTSRHM